MKRIYKSHSRDSYPMVYLNVQKIKNVYLWEYIDLLILL